MTKFFTFPRSVGTNPPSWPFSLNRDSQQAQGLVGWWPLAGRNIGRDMSGHNNHASTVSGELFEVPSSLSVRATGFTRAATDFLEMPLAPIIPVAAPRSITAWAKVAQTDISSDHRICRGLDTAESPHVNSQIWYDTAGGEHSWATNFANTASAALSLGEASANFTSGVWAFIVGTGVNGGSNNIKLYIDGELDSEGTLAGNLHLMEIFRIGASSFVPIDEAADAQIFDVRLYNRALSAAEAYAMYSPTTRWDLYYELKRRMYLFTPTPPPVITVSDYRFRHRFLG